jgi:hypothetical protein
LANFGHRFHISHVAQALFYRIHVGVSSQHHHSYAANKRRTLKVGSCDVSFNFPRHSHKVSCGTSSSRRCPPSQGAGTHLCNALQSWRTDLALRVDE